MKILVFIGLILLSCSPKVAKTPTENSKKNANNKIRLIIDTDANNELDDQHALAYAFNNQDIFDIEGITINNTRYGDGIEGHYQEAMRILKLCNEDKNIPVFKGASGLFSDIVSHVNENEFDGKDAVDFIIAQAKLKDERKLVLLPVGKLTNIALALRRAPEIRDRITVVWLGSNYPEPGEYNLDNDTTSVNPVIQSGVPFEMVVVRYDKPSGTGAVSITREEINSKMPGKGVVAKGAVEGRHGGEFKTFGDYSVNLFEHAQMHGNPPARSLFDMAAVAVLKNPTWAQKVKIPAPQLSGNSWIVKDKAKHSIWIWENFKRDAIIEDMFRGLNKKK
jgi:inosine-uridine nucleoside N-ribohydrolase